MGRLRGQVGVGVTTGLVALLLTGAQAGATSPGTSGTSGSSAPSPTITLGPQGPFTIQPNDTCGPEKQVTVGGNTWVSAVCESWISSNQINIGGINDTGSPTYSGHLNLTGPNGINVDACSASYGNCTISVDDPSGFASGQYCLTLWHEYNGNYYDMADVCATSPF